MESHESHSSYLLDESRARLYNHTVTAGRKRREKLFKKFAIAPPTSCRGRNLIRQGLLKRAGVRSSIYFLDGGKNDEKDGGFHDLLSRMAEKQGLSELVECGLARSRSFPPESRQPSRYILQISKIGCAPSENSAVGRVSIEDKACATGSTPSAPCKPYPNHVGAPLQRACTDIDQLCVPEDVVNEMHRRDADVTMLDEQPQAASHITQEAVANGLFLAGKTALLRSLEGSLPVPNAQTRLEVTPVKCKDHPPSAKVLICGRRREMEDTATIVPYFSGLPCVAMTDTVEGRQSTDLHFHGVYDGHGGSQASKYCEERLHHALAEEITSSSMSVESSNRQQWQRVMSSCFMKVDKEVGGVCPYGACDDVDSTAGCCVGTIAPENTGTTAVVAVVSSSQIILANCGDSRAVLSRGGIALPLSEDHKPERSDETGRIEAAGGQVVAWRGYRVGALLAVSRAIGDRYLKRYVISEPDVTCVDRTEEDECLILASDGLWDVIDNATACDVARRCLATSRRSHEGRVTSHGDDYSSAAAAATLVKLACGKGSQDNITVVVIDLRRKKK